MKPGNRSIPITRLSFPVSFENQLLWRCRESTNTRFREGTTGFSITLQHGITTQHWPTRRKRSPDYEPRTPLFHVQKHHPKPRPGERETNNEKRKTEVINR